MEVETELMWKILSTDNLNHVIKQVQKNKGKSGVDGMTVDEVKAYFYTLDFVEGLNRKIVGMRNYYFTTSLSRKWLAKID